ncbi:uncharacterized protein LOC111337445 isoform X2 [Stylophora pistillata]|uniref:Netrin receptor UNC5C n=1 Tax=Stylophora pistillata TaxID=50429 RepID=A0A2B4RT63_STYPI|nr:uncharacterized protein LOC111337445 isoform X2 [Stylophora pistillata]PFX19993.1 Netrin receptor UNC5C [Stylophora pistillata]
MKLGVCTVCNYDEFEVEDVFSNVSCHKCPSCPPGMGLTPQCGSFVSYGEKVKCGLCELGKSYSSTNDISSCQPCGICSDHENIKRNCSLTNNSQCKHGCGKGFYFEELTGDCKPCSFCYSYLPNCNKTNDLEDGCKDMPFYKQCDANEIGCQLPKCRKDQYLVVTQERDSAHCKECKTCPAGTSLFPPCGNGTIIGSIDDTKCIKCSRGKTFSNKPSKQTCKPCSTCSVGQKELTPCNLTHDRVCGQCEKGFYGSDDTGCKPCSACCNDKDDVRIPECQNMAKNKQCSYTDRSITVCREQNRHRKLSQENSPIVIILSTVSGALLIIMVILVIIKRVKCRRSNRYQRSDSCAALLTPVEEAPQNESITLEDPTTHGSQKTLHFDKSGVLIQFNDASCFFNDSQGIRLEICCDGTSTHRQSDEVQLSPLIKFHPFGKQLSEQVQVRIPHSALVYLSNGWDIRLKCSVPHKESIVWKEENKFQVHNNEVSFQVDNLTSYVIIGKSRDNNKPTKKRFQCAVFGGVGTVGVDYTAYLYVFDDSESSFEKIMQAEESTGRTLLGSPQSLYIEIIRTSTKVKISVKQPVEGWIVGETRPEFITQASLKESYQTIPRAAIHFKHDNGRNRDFLCILELTAEDTTTTICAVASIREDPYGKFQGHQPGCVDDSYPIVNGRNLCDPLIINQDKPSPCLKDLPEEVLQALSEKLDMFLKGVGNWRHVATCLGFTEEEIQIFRNEMLTSDGSPCTVMLEALMEKSPQFTVAEFVHILQERKIQRFDAVEVLEPHLYNSRE